MDGTTDILGMEVEHFAPFSIRTTFCSGPPAALVMPWLLTMTRKVYTLVFPMTRDGRILLGLKKRGFGEGRYNGFGGKVEPGETVMEAAKRELSEEANIISLDLTPCGRIEFAFANSPVLMDVHVFRAEKWEGTPTETEEMSAEWHSYNLNVDSQQSMVTEYPAIPFDRMWLDDKLWFPLLVSFETFVGRVDFDVPAATEGKMEDGQMRKWWFSKAVLETV